MCTCPDARRLRKRCSTASSSCRTRSSARAPSRADWIEAYGGEAWTTERRARFVARREDRESERLPGRADARSRCEGLFRDGALAARRPGSTLRGARRSVRSGLLGLRRRPLGRAPLCGRVAPAFARAQLAVAPARVRA